MLQRWKLILTHWINCYFETNRDEQISIESLLNIISHLRENLNLDESKSAILEAQTVEEFISEKFPEFKFENGTVEASDDEEICLSASLLLFFVCVNSKNLDIKNAMCSKLSSEDQETILKFSKSLMECPVITVREVEAAITESCGQDIAAMEPRQTVPQTPPVLRSLHSEVRRLQAALDAEKFDRNYLQEELLRTHSKLEHLLQEKEQHKVDILNLKAKISSCCGEEGEAKSAEAAADRSGKLKRKLQQMETQLEETLVQLNDVIYERDAYKGKIDELKHERDKWLNLSQEENAQVTKLTEELETERRNIQSLRDLVAELQQHNRMNGMDTSSLECDDPDASIHSLPHNVSVCSEACANVVEVQLGEERAKIVVLKQQIQALQDQINELNKTSKTEKETMESILAQKEIDVSNLQHRIVEEIEHKNNLKTHCDNEMTKLNNEINELQQKLKDNNDYLRSVIENKMVEIQTLQEEKLSLLQSLNNETTKLENVIKNLRSELDSEKQARLHMRETYENRIMKLNEKVLNRNNELVELQNSIFEKGEKIETLQIELRNLKEELNELKIKYQDLDEQNNSIENDLIHKRDEVQNFQIKLQHNSKVIEDLNMEIQQLKTSISSLDENCKTLQGVKEQLLSDIQKRDSEIEQTLNDLNLINKEFKVEKEKISQDMDERNATVHSLQIQLQNEIKFKISLQTELTQMQIANNNLSQEFEKISTELSKCKSEIEDKDRTIDAMDLYIKEEKKHNDQANEKVRKLQEDIVTKDNSLKILNNKLEHTTKCLDDEIKKNIENTEVANNKLLTEIVERETLQLQLNSLLFEKSQLEKDLSVNSEMTSDLQDKCKELSRKVEENESLIKFHQQKVNDACKKYDELNTKSASNMEFIYAKVNVMHDAVTQWTNLMELKIKEKESILQKLGNDMEVIKNIYENTTHTLQKVQNKNKMLTNKLREEKSTKINLENDYVKEITNLNNVISKYEEQKVVQDLKINEINIEIQSLLKTIDVRAECLKALEEQLNQEIQSKNELSCQKEKEIKKLETEIVKLQSTTEELKQEHSKEIEVKTQEFESLERGNKQLRLTIDKIDNSHAIAIKEKESIISKLEQQVKENILKFEDLRQYAEELKTSWDNYQGETKIVMQEKEDKIGQLNGMALILEQKLNEVEQEKGELTKHILEIDMKLENLTAEEKALRDVYETEKEHLLKENEILSQKLSNERSIRTILEEEKSSILVEQLTMKQQLNEEIETSTNIIREKECLTQQLIEEKSIKEITEKEKELLITEKNVLEEKINENEKEKSMLCQKIHVLNVEKEELRKDLKNKIADYFETREEIEKLRDDFSKQQSVNENLLQKNQSLICENDEMAKDLLRMNSSQDKLRDEKESLEMALQCEKSTREIEKSNLAVKLELELINKEEEHKSLTEAYNKLKEKFEEYKEEQESILKEKEWLLLDFKNALNVLKAEKESLDKALNVEKANRDQIQSEKNALAVKLELELITKEDERKALVKEIAELRSTLLSEKETQVYLIKDKESIVAENESLVLSLNTEKGARDELETEKKDLLLKLEDLHRKLDEYEVVCNDYACDVVKKEKEAVQFQTALKQLESKYQSIQETNKQVATSMIENFDKLVHKLKEDNTGNDIIEQLLKDRKYENLPFAEAFELVFTIAHVLSSEVSLLKKLEIALKNENVALSELQESLKQKENQIFDLQSEIKRLKQVVNVKETERIKQSETYATSMQSKISDIQTLQQENKMLHNELNDVKVQLEVKVYSLKEKLNDNENVTDKLKRSYECQIDNLNVMVTKLTNYLKEKAVEFDELQKNKIELEKIIADKDKNIQETNAKLSTAICEGVNKLVQKFKEENITNEALPSIIKGTNFEDVPLAEAYKMVLNIADVLLSEVSLLNKLQGALKIENAALIEIQDIMKQKDTQIFELQTEIKRLEQVINENKIVLSNQTESYNKLLQENKTLNNELNNVRVQLEVKVHSLKEKLVDNDSSMDKLKKSYDCKIDNLNVMITKLTNYLKEKTVELDALRKDKEVLQQTVGDSCKVIKTLEDDVKTEKHNIDKLRTDFEAERQILKNMVTVTESVMEDQKLSLNNVIAEQQIAKDCIQVENNELKNLIKELEMKHHALEMVNSSLFSLVKLERKNKENVEEESETVRDYLDEVISYLSKERNTNVSVISALEFQEKTIAGDYEKIKKDNHRLIDENKDLMIELKTTEEALQKVLEEKSKLDNQLESQVEKLDSVMKENTRVEKTLHEKTQILNVIQLEMKELKNKVNDISHEKCNLELENKESTAKLEEYKAKINFELKEKEELVNLKLENQHLNQTIEENRTVITNLEQLIKHELEENHKLREENEREKLDTANKCSLLQELKSKNDRELEERQKEIIMLQKQVDCLKSKVDLGELDSKAKDGIISKMSKEKDAIICTISKELVEEKAIKEKYEKELQTQQAIINELRNNMEIRDLKKENEQLIKAIGQQETFSAICQEKAADKYTYSAELRDHHKVDNSSSDNTHSSVESLKTITDLEKIIHDKNRTITTLQTDITYLKTIMAESETKLLDVNKELEVTKENCQQLSNQLKKIVFQKNEEIAELKKQVNKMTATETRASQIIKVSAKYQAMILKRISEIKSNTVLKELTNIGNSNNFDNDLRRSLNAGTITMEDLENFLETTDRHLKRCAEKQIALTKERDRLSEVNRINESEIINLKKFLTELSVSFQTFSSVKDLYGNKLSRIVSVQRTVRREILNLDGRITDAVMCKLERGYGAAMQDLSECTMTLERWVERCISRTVSVEKIKQAFTSDSERSSLATPSFQNTGLEIQLDELEKSFQKLLEEVARAVKGEGSKETQASTVMEVRAEYEDKLNRMKAKMKDLFNEQMAVLKNKQREEIGLLERELQKTRDRMEESKRAYESHIRDLTKELWNVGEKYLVKNDEAEWLRKKQRSGSLMSLQHVHSSGLVPVQEPPSRPSDAQSLRSLPVSDNNPKKKNEGRGVHMSDEEGEVFDNRWLKELAATPRREPPAHRLSELKWRNSLCPPHLKSSYPAETQFAPVLDEDDIKAGMAIRAPRKEVGITAYKKPGPPTPSKQAGRLSATDSELRESLRVDHDPHAHTERKPSTPARFRAFLRLNKHDSNEGTPRRKLSSIFRKK